MIKYNSYNKINRLLIILKIKLKVINLLYFKILKVKLLKLNLINKIKFNNLKILILIII